MSDLDQLAINTIRTLAIDAVQKANSGHPGTPMGMAPTAYTLWQKQLAFDPADPIWPNRDRFVLSVGHASMLLYALLHLTRTQAVDPDYEQLGKPSVTLDDIKSFRQLGSKCPGHPEYHLTSGVEATTGPLGQGVAMSVGMAIAREWQANYFNRPGYEIFNYNVYALCGAGCMMEGISGEAASLAGHLKLDHLCWIYDSNRVTIEGSTELAFTEDVAARFLAYGWSVLRVRDANNTREIGEALARFLETKGQPTLILIESHIGYGAPHKQDSAAAHGEPLGADEVRLVKRAYGWPEDAQFLVPDTVYAHFRKGIGERGARLRAEWEDMLTRYRKNCPEIAEAIGLMQRRELPKGWDTGIPSFPHDSIGVGEDGPTHQPVEQLASLRAIPGLLTLRPCDANEAAEAWRLVMPLKHQPACLVLSRQALPTLDRSRLAPASGVARGAYVLLHPPKGKPDVILIGTGSEVSLCLDAADELAAEGIKARVVSMPSWELFEQQDAAYRAEVLPPEIKARVSVEQAATIGWERYVGMGGAKIGMHTFGASAPLKALLTKFGFTPDRVAEAARDQVAQARKAQAPATAG